jgi:type I restriction enzyme R subunit
MLAAILGDNVNLRPHLEEFAAVNNVATLDAPGNEGIAQLTVQIAPLLRFLSDVSLAVMTFEARAIRWALAHLIGHSALVDSLREQARKDVALLPITLPEVQEQAEIIDALRHPEFWKRLTYDHIMNLQATLAPLMPYRLYHQPEVLQFRLPEEIVRRRWIIYEPSSEGAFADSYRAKVETGVKTLAWEHPKLRKLH